MHSYLLLGAAGNGKTFFANKMLDVVQCKTETIECWQLKQIDFNYQQFFEQKEKLLLYFKDVDALFMNGEKSKANYSFVQFMLTYPPNIYVIADTNKVNSINNSMIELFEYKVYFNFPSKEERIQMLKNCLPIFISQNVLDSFIDLTNGFTFSDIIVLIRDAQMRPIRKHIQDDVVDMDDYTCSENDILESLYALKPSYSESDKKQFEYIAHKFRFYSYSNNY